MGEGLGEDGRRPWPEVLDGSTLRIVGTRKGRVFHLATSECGRSIYASNLVSFESDLPPQGVEGPADEHAPREGLGRTRNVSQGGILLEVARAYPLSAVLDLRIALGEAIIAPKARVVRLQELAGDRVEMGLKFVELSAADRSAITAFVSTHPEIAG